MARDTASIYALRDPRTDETRYIGVTEFCIYSRRDHHVFTRNARKWRNSPKSKWIRELHSLGLRPIVALIDHVPGRDWDGSIEEWWIGWYRRNGAPLFNVVPKPPKLKKGAAR